MTDATRSTDARLARLAHELRTPLHALLGTVELLRDTPLDDVQRAHVATVEETARALAALADAALESATGGEPRARAAAVAAPCLVCDVAGGVARLFAPAAAAKGIALRVDVGAEVPARLSLDAAALRQILVNLVANAVRHTATGEVVVRAGWEAARAGAAPLLRVDVADTGPGIAPELRERLFAPLARDDAERRGAGLGLSISRELARAAGGDVTVGASAAGGSVFHVVLPVLAIPDGAAGADARAPSVRPARVLVVDDDAVARLVATRMCDRVGSDCTVAEGSATALAALARARAAGTPFELVLLDQRLGGEEDGAAVASAWRSRERAEGWRCVPIVALTGDAGDEASARARAAGMDAYLAKPASLAVLTRLIDAVRAAGDALDGRGSDDGTPPLGEAGLMDLATLERLLCLGGDATFAPALVRAWVTDAERRVLVVAAAHAVGDVEARVRAAHALVGSSANVGAAAVAACAARIQQAGERDGPRLQMDVASLARLVAGTRAALRAAVARAVRGRTPLGGMAVR